MTEDAFAMQNLKLVGLTQAEFGQIIGVSRPTANLWINGRKTPSAENREAIARLAPLIRQLLGRGGVATITGRRRELLIARLHELVRQEVAEAA